MKTLLLGLSMLLNAALAVTLAFVFFAPLANAPAGVMPPTEPAPAPTAASGSIYEIQLDGAYPTDPSPDPNVPFQGECRMTKSDISSEAKGVNGVTPKTVSFSGQAISCNLQKQSANAFRLKASVKKDGVTVREISTASSYGSVSFSV